MDEVGSAIKHSDKPNVAVHPLIYTPYGKIDDYTITYSVILINININEYRFVGLFRI